MTTSISNPETSASPVAPGVPEPPPAEPVHHRAEHSLASRFIFLTICVAIVLSALAFGTVHYWALGFFTLGALAIVSLWVWDASQLGRLRISTNLLQIPIIGMAVLAFIQLLPLRGAHDYGVLSSGATRSFSLDPYSTRLVLAQVLALLVYFSASLVFTDTPKRLRLLVRTIIIFGFALALFGLTQSFTSPDRIYWFRELSQAVAFGPFINRHHFAGYMEMTIALPLGLLFAGAIEREKRFIYIFAAGMMGIALIMTNSRGGIISLVAQILFLTVMTVVRRWRRARHKERPAKRLGSAALGAGLALALIISMLAGVVLMGGEASLSRFVGTVNAKDPTSGRSHFWSVTLDIIKEYPVLGTGLGAFGVVYTRYDSRNGLFRLEQAHNDYLQVFADGGIVGAALGLFFVVMLLKIGFARRESHDYFRRGVAMGGLAGCFAVLVHSFFDFTLHTTANALLFLVLAALATMNGRVEHAHSGRRRRRRRRSVGEK